METFYIKEVHGKFRVYRDAETEFYLEEFDTREEAQNYCTSLVPA